MRVYLFIIVLVIISGLVSYAADRIGHSFSKRRLSLLGIRPKYISTAVAVISGIFISLITFLILTLLVADFRKMVFESTKIEQELINVQKELKVAQELSDKAKKEQEINEFRLKNLTLELQTLFNQKTKLANELNVAKSSLNSKQQELLRKQMELKTAEKKLKTTRSHNQILLAENYNLQQKNEHLVKLGAQLQSELEFKEKVIKGLGEEGKEIWQKVTKGKLILPINLPLAYLLIPADTNPTTRKLLILDTLRRIKAQLALKNLNYELPDDNTLNSYANLITQTEQEYIIIFTTARNIFEAETVQLTALAVPNKVVFKANELLINYEPSPNQEKTSILNELIQALQKLRNDAIELGLLPDINTGEVGSISRDALINAIETAMKTPEHPKTIKIYSGEEVKANGNLDKLIIEVD